ncbi:hypothetical protein GQ607_003782 [Colletotrichum asianum]|uniref:Uncharacterized protein n=1 Tax=Colletotrichum asianum TaxID=702518 RepID=A0A8H3WKT4_9PEZI|nr:hypothetical protein GQ607_003782 [Colletotrichum asianum]
MQVTCHEPQAYFTGILSPPKATSSQCLIGSNDSELLVGDLQLPFHLLYHRDYHITINLTFTSDVCQTSSLTNKPSIPHRRTGLLHRSRLTTQTNKNAHMAMKKPPNPKTSRVDSLNRNAQHPRMLTWPNTPAAGRMRRTTAKTCVFPCRRPFPSHAIGEYPTSRVPRCMSCNSRNLQRVFRRTECVR